MNEVKAIEKDMINNGGWAISMIMSGKGLQSGVEAMSDKEVE